MNFKIKYKIKNELNPIIDCECNCGNFLLKYDTQGRERKYIFKHSNKTLKPPSRKGALMSPIAKEKISSFQKNYKKTEEHKRKIFLKLRGKKRSHEHCEKMKRIFSRLKEEGYVFGWKKGKPLSEEHRKILFNARLNFVYPKKDTKPEKMVQLALELKGIKFEKHKAIKGICQPDIFVEPNCCIFVDGDYWHANPEKWSADDIIIGNVKASDIWKKDLRQMHELNKNGYIVIRVWESDIKINSGQIAENIINMMNKYRKGELKI